MEKGLPALIFCLIFTPALKAQQSVSMGTTSATPSPVWRANALNKDRTHTIPVVKKITTVPTRSEGKFLNKPLVAHIYL
jgi:hypothetical protein